MKHTQFLALAILAAFAMIGCDKTAEGIQRDAAENSQKAASAASKTSEDMKAGASNAEAAVILTTAVKAALVANPLLNENGNLIDVDSTSESVTLNGHVKSQTAKDEADKIAKKVLADKNATQALVNKLIIDR